MSIQKNLLWYSTIMYVTPQQIFIKKNRQVLTKCTGIKSIDTITAIFFLLSKPEHNNQSWDKTFISSDGKSVFFYAERLKYDGPQRGVTVGLAGFTTANSGKDAWGDFHPLATRYKRMGGVDLTRLARGLTTNTKKASEFCRKIHRLKGKDADLFVRAQLKCLCRPGGYIYEAMDALKNAGIPSPTPVTIAAVVDTMINQGIGGKWCPKKWLEQNPATSPKRESALLRDFLRWKRVSATKNHHNSPPSNGEKRSDMFLELLDMGSTDLDRAACERVVTWKML